MIPTLQLGQTGLARRSAGGGGGGGTSVTWNPADKGTNIALSESDKLASKINSGAWETVRALTAKSSGKWQADFEVVHEGSAQGVMIGICKSSVAVSNYLAIDANGFAYYGDGSKYTSNAGAAYGNTFTTGDIITIYWDADAGKLYFGKNNVVQNSGDPAAGTGAAFTGLSGSFYPACSVFYNGGPSSVRCKDRTSTLATGFLDWTP